MSLGFIGTIEAEAALVRLASDSAVADEIVQGLIACGTASAIAMVVELARNKPRGSMWLCERLRHWNFLRGWTRGEYYTHIETTELVNYLDAEEPTGSLKQNWDLVDAFRQIDSPEVRRLLRKWAQRRGTTEDRVVRESDQRRMSDMCFDELTTRGDEFAIPYVLGHRADADDNVYLAIAAELRHFPSELVAIELRRRLF